MKPKSILFSLTIASSLALSWGILSFAEGTSENTPMSRTPGEDGQRNNLSLAAMEKEQKRIVDRLQISAPMELELENGVDPVLEAYRSGYIVDATLEEVEAAMKAAAATPELEDDKAALRLRHRGSYRFFAPEASK